ncbi:MAG TPA: ribosome maturation factor RimM [Chitinophagaceae bacterium]|nr:ribosome maturation factor RimM [Chitinophagaceae bacterium]
MIDYYCIGTILSAHGLKGELVFSHGLKELSPFNGTKVIFLEENPGTYLPYFLQSSIPHKSGRLYLRLEGIHSREAAQTLRGKSVYLGKEDYFRIYHIRAPHTWLGFQVMDKHLGSLGQITEVMETPAQVLASVKWQGKSLLIPLNEETILNLDGDQRLLTISLPEGLPGLPS